MYSSNNIPNRLKLSVKLRGFEERKIIYYIVLSSILH